MKTQYALSLTLCVAALLSASAAEFDSGSDGSYGPIMVPRNRSINLAIPPDGIFRCTTIDVECQGELRFTPNARNTPVYLLATGRVRIVGSIFVEGQPRSANLGGAGGPGGFPGGMGGVSGGHGIGGDGSGPGGGKNMAGWRGGVFAAPQGANTNAYGNALIYPLIGGSGGAGANDGAGGGGGGGGALLVASNERIEIINGCGPFTSSSVSAMGGAGAASGGGSGGAIRLIAPVVTGDGVLNCSATAPASPGRVRIDCLDDYAFRSLTPLGSFTRGSQMWVFRPNSPRLDVIFAAGREIPEGASGAVAIALPFGAPTNQTVTLSARDFTGPVPVRIVVTPDTGPSLAYDREIPNAGNPSTASFDIGIPEGTVSRIDAWTR